MRIAFDIQAGVDSTLPLMPIGVWTASALPLELEKIPSSLGGGTVTGVTVSVTNADGVTVRGECRKVGGSWLVLFAGSNFANYGTVVRGVRFDASVNRPDGSRAVVAIGIADLVIKPGSVHAVAGDPSSSVAHRGDDSYYKTYVQDGQQHYKRAEVVYDADMGDWGFELVGDYVLVGGVFVEYSEG